MPTKVNIKIRGHALCYLREASGSTQKVWHIVFVCDDEHLLSAKFTGVSPDPDLRVKNKDQTFTFTVANNGIQPTPPSATISSLLNLSDDTYAHGTANGKSKLKHDRRKNKTDLVTMILPYNTQLTVTGVNTGKKTYVMKVSPDIKIPAELLQPTANELTATFAINNDMTVTVGAGGSAPTFTHTYAFASATSSIEITLNNDCGNRCNHNDSIDVYEVVSEKISPHEEVKYVSWKWPPDPTKDEAFRDDAVILGKAGNCDPILIDPFPEN